MLSDSKVISPFTMSSNLYSVLRGTRKRITGSRPAASLAACSEGVKFAQVPA